MPDQSAERVETVTILINVRHAAPQARLQLLGVVAEYQHDGGPGEGGKGGPGVLVDLGVQGLGRDEGEADAGLDGDAGEGEGGARKDVDDDLLVDGGDFAGACPAAEDEVAADEAAKEGIVCA